MRPRHTKCVCCSRPSLRRLFSLPFFCSAAQSTVCACAGCTARSPCAQTPSLLSLSLSLSWHTRLSLSSSTLLHPLPPSAQAHEEGGVGDGVVRALRRRMERARRRAEHVRLLAADNLVDVLLLHKRRVAPADGLRARAPPLRAGEQQRKGGEQKRCCRHRPRATRRERAEGEKRAQEEGAREGKSRRGQVLIGVTR